MYVQAEAQKTLDIGVERGDDGDIELTIHVDGTMDIVVIRASGDVGADQVNAAFHAALDGVEALPDETV